MQLLADLLAFNISAEKSLLQWHSNDQLQGQSATPVDWHSLLAEALTALLCGDTEQSRLEALDTWLQDCPRPQAQAVRSAVALFGHRPAQSIALFNDSTMVPDNTLA
ncbi:MAG: hypothetical protein AAF404_19010, partial [Pseudomonadota bacterium]